jgi:ribosome biogenesis GTPase / thiamine phosphate phosphatase
VVAGALDELGWTDERAAELAALGDDLVAARVVIELRGLPQVAAGGAPFAAAVSGGLRHRKKRSAGALPAIGDWVAVRRPDDGPAQIAAVLPRRTALTRVGPDGRERVLAANVDRAVIVMGLDGDYNPRRLERFLALCGAAGVAVAIVLSKADLYAAERTAERRAEVIALAGDAPVAALDLRHDDVAGFLAPLVPAGRTAVLLGSSGAGKSTLTNRLLGADVQRTQAVRVHDHRGQHTTTHRQLFALPWGALLIDTPGLRTLSLGEGDDDPRADLAAAFPELAEVARGCQFSDCRHAGEPGCAVAAALAGGELDPARVAGYRKLLAERSGAASDGRPPRRRKR